MQQKQKRLIYIEQNEIEEKFCLKEELYTAQQEIQV